MWWPHDGEGEQGQDGIRAVTALVRVTGILIVLMRVLGAAYAPNVLGDLLGPVICHWKYYRQWMQ